MTSTSQRQRVRRMSREDAGHVIDLLERDFRDSRAPAAGLSDGALAHQFLLDAIDRRQYERFLLWPGNDPLAVLFSGSGGTLVPAGNPVAGAALADAAENLGWRVLVGDAPLGWALLDGAGRAGGRLFRRRVNAREQRLMAIRAHDVASVDGLAPRRPDPDGLRLAHVGDLDALVEQACRLHVEDQMGPPIARSARGGVRQRLSESVALRQTWIVERGGRPVAKADLSLSSPRRGAQIAGVFVDEEVRGAGVGGGLVAALVRMLLRNGAPAVSLHVRADNAPAIAAYRSAGLVDRRPWVLALR